MTITSGSARMMVNLLDAVTEFHNRTGDARMQTSTMMCFLHIGMRGEVPQTDLKDIMGVASKTSVTRALQTLGRGVRIAGQRMEGLGWVSQEEDPMDGKRKIARLTPAGLQVLRAIEKAASRY